MNLPSNELVINDPDALPPFRTATRTYTPPAAPKSNRQAAALEAALRRKARWERRSAPPGDKGGS